MTLMLSDPKDVRVSLEVNGSPTTTLQFAQDLGPLLQVFKTGLHSDRVWTLNAPPGFADGRSDIVPDLTALHIGQDASCRMSLCSNSVAKELTRRLTFKEDAEQAKLLSQGEDATVSRISPCSFCCYLGEHAGEVHYPYPLFGVVSKIRHARQGSYIEVVGPVHFPSKRGGYDPWRFPAVVSGREIMQWSFSNVNFQQLPVIPLGSDFSWIEKHLAMAFSAEESSTTNGQLRSTLHHLKISINSIFLAFASLHPDSLGHPIGVFMLRDNEGTCDTIIVAKNMLYDFNNASVVLEAYLLYVTEV